MSFLDRLGLTVPLVQAPMAGVSTPALAAAVSNAGALGSIGIGAADVSTARAMIDEVRTRTAHAFNVNVFVHQTPIADPARDAAWREWLAPQFAAFSATPPKSLRIIYRSFAEDPEMQAMLLDTAPPVISFHFGLPPEPIISALRARGCLLLATATNLHEAQLIAASGLDAIIAQGIEAGGHRGMFDPKQPDNALGLLPLTRMLSRQIDLPIIAAGGIMDGAGIAAVLGLGAAAAQLGTAFIACPESAADDHFKAALTGPAGHQTVMTSLISGRPARALANRFTARVATLGTHQPPDYPIAYDAAKALHAAAKAQGDHGFGAHWAGQGAPLSRAMPAATLVKTLMEELENCVHPQSNRDVTSNAQAKTTKL